MDACATGHDQYQKYRTAVEILKFRTERNGDAGATFGGSHAGDAKDAATHEDETGLEWVCFVAGKQTTMRVIFVSFGWSELQARAKQSGLTSLQPWLLVGEYSQEEQTSGESRHRQPRKTRPGNRGCGNPRYVFVRGFVAVCAWMLMDG